MKKNFRNGNSCRILYTTVVSTNSSIKRWHSSAPIRHSVAHLLVSFGNCSGSTSSTSSGSILTITVLLHGLLLNDIEHLALDGLLFEYKAVLVPDEVGVSSVK